jgi:3-hydroxyisobutyrate dehydrogenase
MGYRMARNLLSRTQGPFLIHDAVPATMQRFQDEADSGLRDRIKAPGSVRAVAEQANVVITMLPESQHVDQVYCGVGGILEALRPGTLCIDSSTIAPDVSQSVTAAVIKAGGHSVDAPVSGGVLGAQAGTLTFMVGGTEADFNRAKPYLETMGKNIVHCGEAGTGQIAKICNNMLLGISMLGTAEVMRLGVKLGMDPKLLANILNTSSGCWSSDTYNPCPGVMENVPSSRNYEGGFGVALMAKDMRLAVEAATQARSTTLLGAVAQQVYGQVSRTPGLEGKDFSVVYEWLGGAKETA